MVVKQPFSTDGKLNFFSIATFMTDYENNADAVNITIPVQVLYDLGGGFSLTGGGRINNVVGFSPLTGFQHNYASREILAISSFTYFLNSESDLQLFGLYEFKPGLGSSWSFYSRLQFLYSHNPKEGLHNRSYFYARAGLKKGKLAFGLGMNLDRFGPFKSLNENYGPFVRWDL